MGLKWGESFLRAATLIRTTAEDHCIIDSKYISNVITFPYLMLKPFSPWLHCRNVWSGGHPQWHC